MTKKNAWLVEPDLIDGFLDILTDNGFKWNRGEKANEFEGWDYGDTIVFIEEDFKTLIFDRYFSCPYDPDEEYNLTEVTEKWLSEME